MNGADSALAVWGTDKKHFAIMSFHFSGREKEQISSPVPMACYPAQLERDI